MTAEPELERFKREIKIYEYMATKGYQLDKEKSSKKNMVMKGPRGDTVITRESEKGWEFFDPETRTGGSIIQFIQNQLGEDKNLGEIRKELRPWIGEINKKPYTPDVQYKKFEKPITEPVIDKTPAVLKTLKGFTQNAYLEYRHIDPETQYIPKLNNQRNKNHLWIE